MIPDANILIHLAGGALYGQPLIEEGHDVDITPIPDIPVVNATTWRQDIRRGYGYLYNRHAVEDARNMAPEGYRVAGMMDSYDYWTLKRGSEQPPYDRAGRFKSPRTSPQDHPRWDTPNIGGYPGNYSAPPQNETGFTAIPAGIRLKNGAFFYLGQVAAFWDLYKTYTSSDLIDHVAYTLWNYLGYWWSWHDEDFGDPANNFNVGMSVKLVKEDPSEWVEGETVTDIDGNVYDTVRITHRNQDGEFDMVWTVQNLSVTRFRNGDQIPLLESDGAWSSTSEAAMCAPLNDMFLATRREPIYIPGARMFSSYEENLLAIGNNLLKERDMNHLLAERRLV